MNSSPLSRRLGRLAIIAVLPLLAGCVELAGQRLTLIHDAAGDRLLLLVAHDGIHELRDVGDKPGAKQLEEYLANGDLMFFDWWGEVKRKKLEAELKREGSSPAGRELLEALLEKVRLQTLGHYRDPQGRIGAYQLLIIPEAGKFVRRVNALVAEIVLEGSGSTPHATDEATQQMRREAKRGHQWLRLDGHSLEVSVPFSARQWHRERTRLLKKLCDEYHKAQKEQEKPFNPSFLIQLFGAEEFFIREGPERLEIRLGAPSRPATLRTVLRDRYSDRLEETVVRLVPQAADAVIARHLLQPGSELPEVWRGVFSRLPPEDRVRAVLGALEDPKREGEAVRWLTAFSEAWGREERRPLTPQDSADAKAWARWYAAMLRLPLD